MLARRGNLARLAALAVLVALISSLGCSTDLAGQAEEPTASTEKKAVVRVSSPEPVKDDLAFPSNLYVERDVWLTPRSTGIIEKVLVARGDRVRAGQELVVLEPDLQQVEVRIAEQSLRYKVAEYERSRTLHEQGILSPQEALRQEIERDLAQSELELARAMLARCTVRAPFDGVVVERVAVPGQRVLEEDGERLLRIVAVDRPRAKVHVPEQRLHGLDLGDDARIEVHGPPRALHPARIVFISPVVDAASDTALVVVEAEAKPDSLKTGGAVSVSFVDSNAPDDASMKLFRIPRQALADQTFVTGERTTVLVASAGRAEAREVDLVDFDGRFATVRGSIGTNDLVIVGGGRHISPGDPVEVRSEAP
jgi:RND family efflux transporter MFP subunit